MMAGHPPAAPAAPIDPSASPSEKPGLAQSIRELRPAGPGVTAGALREGGLAV